MIDSLAPLSQREARQQLIARQLECSKTLRKLWAELDKAVARGDRLAATEIEKDWLAEHRRHQQLAEMIDNLREED